MRHWLPLLKGHEKEWPSNDQRGSGSQISSKVRRDLVQRGSPLFLSSVVTDAVTTMIEAEQSCSVLPHFYDSGDTI
jgi:hypothetical protein